MKLRIGIATVVAAAWLAPLGVQAADGEPRAAAPVKEQKEESRKEATLCETAPGSRIKLSKPQDCKDAAKQPVRVYTKEELDDTGELNTADALRKLDPSIQ